MVRCVRRGRDSWLGKGARGCRRGARWGRNGGLWRRDRSGNVRGCRSRGENWMIIKRVILTFYLIYEAWGSRGLRAPRSMSLIHLPSDSKADPGQSRIKTRRKRT